MKLVKRSLLFVYMLVLLQDTAWLHRTGRLEVFVLTIAHTAKNVQLSLDDYTEDANKRVLVFP